MKNFLLKKFFIHDGYIHLHEKGYQVIRYDENDKKIFIVVRTLGKQGQLLCTKFTDDYHSICQMLNSLNYKEIRYTTEADQIIKENFGDFFEEEGDDPEDYQLLKKGHYYILRPVATGNEETFFVMRTAEDQLLCTRYIPEEEQQKKVEFSLIQLGYKRQIKSQ